MPIIHVFHAESMIEGCKHKMWIIHVFHAENMKVANFQINNVNLGEVGIYYKNVTHGPRYSGVEELWAVLLY